MAIEKEFSIKHSGVQFDIVGTYTPAVPDQWYDQKGDPGTPGTPADFQVERVYWKGINVTDLVNAVDDNFTHLLSEKILER